MSNVTNQIEHAEQHCKTHGARLTSQRKQVLARLIESNRALSAYELVDFCKERYGESIAAMSVYRSLEFLEKEDLVHKLNSTNKFVACAHICREHDHGVAQFLICKECNKITELTLEPLVIDSLRDEAAKAGFTVISPQLEISCVCDECRTKQNNQSKE